MVGSERQIWSETEKRALSPLPDFPQKGTDIVRFFKQLDDYFNDHFGFRDFFIARYQREIEKRFDKKSIHPRVIKGLDGYFFFNDFGLLKDFLGLTPLTQKQLEQFTEIQNQKDDWFRSNGIHYLYAIAPNKQSIYPEKLMENALKLKGTTRYDQLLSHMNHEYPEYMVNLFDLLKVESKASSLYYKNDSHWNKRAAYLVFQNIMEKISQWYPDENFDVDFEFIQDETGIGGNTGQGGDLVQIIRRPHLTETYPQVKRYKRCDRDPHPITYELTNLPNLMGRPSFTRFCATKKLKAVVFRDSFFVPLEPFFSENFAEIIYLWKSYDHKNINEILDHFKPDIVLEIILERHAFDFLDDEKDKNKNVP